MRQANRVWSAMGLAAAWGFALPALAKVPAPVDLARLAADAVSDDAAMAQPAIAGLREAGPPGLEALISAHRPLIERAIGGPNLFKSELQWQHLHAALDAVGAQRDCYASGLYWYTDFESARQAARREGKHILSLRLLGNLTDELSCANSRFFRTVLYANKDVSRVLREQFVLHWQSVRPVPKVTIEFGDGRKLVRTLTGNSIHYVLDAEGRPLDALPGLYGPKAFLRGLEQAAALADRLQKLNDGDRIAALRGYHEQRAATITRQWQDELAKIAASADGDSASPHSHLLKAVVVAANERTAAKADTERVLLAGALAEANVLAAATDDATWARLAQLHQGDAALDPASVALLRAKNPLAAQAAPLAVSKMVVESPLIRLVRDFQHTIAIDTVRNEYTFHRQIHEWFARDEVPADLDVFSLNERVYAELFLTPSSDPWLGLVPAGVYTALDDNGICQE